MFVYLLTYRSNEENDPIILGIFDSIDSIEELIMRDHPEFFEEDATSYGYNSDHVWSTNGSEFIAERYPVRSLNHEG